MKLLKAEIEKSYFIKGRGFIVELMHEENGIKKDTILMSEKSGLIWKMQSRLLFDHALNKQRLFEIEDVDYMLLKFENIQKKMKSVDEIVEKENRNIF